VKGSGGTGNTEVKRIEEREKEMRSKIKGTNK
jgi:hypothetical protein